MGRIEVTASSQIITSISQSHILSIKAFQFCLPIITLIKLTNTDLRRPWSSFWAFMRVIRLTSVLGPADF
jgi:hypothetical protein